MGLLKSIKETFHEFSSNTSIHGIKYVGDKERRSVEKIFWLFSILFSLSLCIYMMYIMYEKLHNSNIEVALTEKTMLTSEIPFPAVTICPFPKFRKSSLDFEQTYKRLKKLQFHENNGTNHLQLDPETLEEYKSIEAFFNFCEKFPKSYPFEKNPFLKGEEIMDRFNEISTVAGDNQSYDFFFKVKFDNFKYNFFDVFSYMVTNLGTCWTFNMLPRSEMFENINVK